MHNLCRGDCGVLMAGKAPFSLHGELTGSRDNYVPLRAGPLRHREPGALLRQMEYSLASGVVAKKCSGAATA